MSSPTCCGCIELKTGCYIIAILSVMSNINYSVVFGGNAVVYVAGVNNTYDPKDVHDSGILKAVLYGLLLILAIIGLVYDYVLISGLNGNKPGRIKKYLMVSCLWVLKYINVIPIIIKEAKYKVAAVPIIILTILLEIYFLLAIYRMYNLMKQQTSMVIRTVPTESGQQLHNLGNGQMKYHNGLHSNNDNNFNVQATTSNNFAQHFYPNSYGHANHYDFGQTERPPSYGQVKYNV